MELHVLLLKMAWRLFREIGPTMVALLAIYLNDKNARKREIKNKVIDMKYKFLSEALNSLLSFEVEVTYLMENVAYLTILKKKIKDLSGDDYLLTLREIKEIGSESYKKLKYLLIQKNYFSNSRLIIEQVYSIKLFDDEFKKELINFHDNVSGLLGKIIDNEIEHEELTQCFNPLNNQINLNKIIILEHIKDLTIV